VTVDPLSQFNYNIQAKPSVANGIHHVSRRHAALRDLLRVEF